MECLSGATLVRVDCTVLNELRLSMSGPFMFLPVLWSSKGQSLQLQLVSTLISLSMVRVGWYLGGTIEFF